MSTELFFLYDSHCPWSYKATQLVKHIHQAYPKITVNLFHCGHFDGDQVLTRENINAVEEHCACEFNESYLATLAQAKDSTLALNLLSWAQNRAPKKAFELLQALQNLHFEQGNALSSYEELSDTIEQLKLSPPSKVFTLAKYTKDAEMALQSVVEIQEIIGTEAIPALLLAIDDRLILLNHNLYLTDPEKIIEAVKLELANS
ncbi:hypothetical protein [Thalassotalea sp. PLHSN55]|uniref:hypothetical protein n=1 Tax=Thalassotalea sp. PLHSN55 TaxID=3435888 RepID=UPI003F86FC4D